MVIAVSTHAALADTLTFSSATAPPTGTFRSFAFASYNEPLDTTQDVLFGTNSGAGLLSNNGSGNLTSVSFFNVGAVVDVYPADVDSDGNLDIVAIGQGELFWFESVSPTLFFFTQRTVSNSALSAFATGAVSDIDGDGSPDIIASNALSGIVEYYRWNPLSGAFDDGVPTGVTGAPTSMAVADLDDDGDEDIVVSNGLSISWIRNETAFDIGVGDIVISFSSAISIDSLSGQTIAPIAVADIDQDGDVDVITTDSLDPVWYPNDGTGSFGTPVSIATTALANGVLEVGDFNADGAADILASSDTTQLTYHVNDGTGGFTASATTALGGSTVFAGGAGDLDADGLDDAISGGTSISVNAQTHLNTTSITQFTDEGFALAGAAGTPRLVAIACGVAGGTNNTLTLQLTSAVPLAKAYLMASPVNNPTFFQGGILVPGAHPDALLPVNPSGNPPTTNAGTRSPVFPIAPGLSGVPLVLQYWIEDASNPSGFSASNGVEAVLP